MRCCGRLNWQLLFGTGVLIKHFCRQCHIMSSILSAWASQIHTFTKPGTIYSARYSVGSPLHHLKIINNKLNDLKWNNTPAIPRSPNQWFSGWNARADHKLSAAAPRPPRSDPSGTVPASRSQLYVSWRWHYGGAGGSSEREAASVGSLKGCWGLRATPSSRGRSIRTSCHTWSGISSS